MFIVLIFFKKSCYSDGMGKVYIKVKRKLNL
jgi:hypothetical protein